LLATNVNDTAGLLDKRGTFRFITVIAQTRRPLQAIVAHDLRFANPSQRHLNQTPCTLSNLRPPPRTGAIVWPKQTMKQLCKLLAPLVIAAGLVGCIAAPIAMTPQTEQRLNAQPPVRFLLTFDDGPSASSFWNPTLTVLDSLAQNPLQPDIKAVFFVQTRASRAGGSEIGHQVMRREHAEGHVIGFHTATPGHSNHRSLDDQALEQSLANGSADIAVITGVLPSLLRPPFWNYDKRTFAAYRQHGLHVLLTDLSANDGKIWGFNASPRRRSHMLRSMSEVRERIAQGELPVVDGVIPVVVTFHDLNRYTARHAREYLQILLDSARETGVKVAQKPFYDDTASLQRAALARTVRDSSQPVQLPGLWNWIWSGDSR
jgi:peptidoglycan/xylan/chitin deacetylase (PgdA/CDA1 family)